MSSIAVQSFNWIDFVIIGIIIVSSLISLMRGFAREAISLATWIVAALVALRFGNLLAERLTPYIHSPSVRMAAAFIGLFLVVIIIGGLINFLFSQLVEKTGLSGTDRLLGLIFGIGRGILLIGVLILLAGMMNFNQEAWWKSSQLIPHFQPIANWLQSFVPEQIGYLTQVFAASN